MSSTHRSHLTSLPFLRVGLSFDLVTSSARHQIFSAKKAQDSTIVVPGRASRRAPAPCNAEWQTCFATCSRLPQKHLTVLRFRTAAHRRLLTLRPEAPRSLAACRSSRLRLLTFAWRNCFGPRCCDAAPADSLDSPRQRVYYFPALFPHIHILD